MVIQIEFVHVFEVNFHSVCQSLSTVLAGTTAESGLLITQIWIFD